MVYKFNIPVIIATLPANDILNSEINYQNLIKIMYGRFFTFYWKPDEQYFANYTPFNLMLEKALYIYKIAMSRLALQTSISLSWLVKT